MQRIARALAAALAAAAFGAAAQEIVATYEPVEGDPKLDLGTYRHPAGGKTLRLFGGAGSGSYRGPGDPPDVLWTVGDRGPNFTCADARTVLELAPALACPADPSRGVAAGVGRLYPRPDYAPSIYRLRLAPGGTLEVLDVIPLRRLDGTPISGLLNPQVTGTTEIPRDGQGRVLDQDASAIDAEGIVRLPHFGGRFFIGEENATGLVEVAADGRILQRFVPAGTAQEYTHPRVGASAGYRVEGILPELLAKRRINRGIESMAVSRDFRFLTFIVQSPLDHPDTSVRDSRNIRIYRAALDPHPNGSTLRLVGEWVYTLDDVDVLRNAGATDVQRVADLRVSEMTTLDDDRLLVIERTDQATALYEIDLRGATNLLGSVWDAPATRPTLEQLGLPGFPALADAGIVPVRKTLRFIASSVPGALPPFARKLEGLALTQQGRLIIVNDDDFGITGERVRVDVVRGAGFGRR